MIKMRAGDSEKVTGGTKRVRTTFMSVCGHSLRELRSVADAVALTDRCLGEGAQAFGQQAAHTLAHSLQTGGSAEITP